MNELEIDNKPNVGLISVEKLSSASFNGVDYKKIHKDYLNSFGTLIGKNEFPIQDQSAYLLIKQKNHEWISAVLEESKAKELPELALYLLEQMYNDLLNFFESVERKTSITFCCEFTNCDRIYSPSTLVVN